MAEREYPADKQSAIADLTERFSNSSAAVLTEYRGLTVEELQELRRSLGEGANYRVAKNTLAKRAANQAGVSGLDDLFTGPTAITFIEGDPVEAAKGLKAFAKAHEALVVKGGVMDGNVLTVEEITKLADLESREVLLAKLAGALQATAQKTAGVLAASASQVARLGAALQEKKAASGE
ncbi:50S ribosomal protein L10 [Glycomyces buryatensis]|uniref:Large ribosomal subunit protein uL10 n=1 Tax=Glycomyces buryatensis TaxID=2570927 RepID=A0A4S8PY94_9ACTN|nr:50S ribosomal protein L10 [Glycomyces buryatensis]THV35631.1 50S ribosomal protein L10 [Glycomyces buryatensis]